MDNANQPGLYWHVHHDVLMEYCYSYDERANYIKSDKPEHEIELRLRLFKPVKATLGDQKLLEVYNKAQEAYNKAWEVYDKAKEVCNEAWKVCFSSITKAELERAHAEECKDCPWDGETIFQNTTS